jgi:hypothetical protein
MTNVSKRLEQIITKELSKTIIPVKTDEGILVGAVLIKCRNNLKFLYRRDELIYGEVFLNRTAVAIATILARQRSDPRADKIYQADQEYARFYTDAQLLQTNHAKSLSNRDFERADTLWARYQETRDRALSAKSRVESLSKSI